MKAITPIRTTDHDALLDLSSEALQTWFFESGLVVNVVDCCDDSTCPDCFGAAPARAA